MIESTLTVHSYEISIRRGTNRRCRCMYPTIVHEVIGVLFFLGRGRLVIRMIEGINGVNVVEQIAISVIQVVHILLGWRILKLLL
jgi:hypothetical protein